MKLLIDNIKRTIIFKDNKAFYKNKKDVVDVTLFFKKSKDGISVLKKKYSHMLVSENKNIIYGGADPVDPLQFKFSTKDIELDEEEAISKRFRKLISLYLMSEIYTSDGILTREIDKDFSKEAEEGEGEVDAKAKAKEKKEEENKIEEEEKEIGKWELVKLTLRELIDFIIENTYNLDALIHMFKDDSKYDGYYKWKVYIKNVNDLVNNTTTLYSAILKQVRIKDTYKGTYKLKLLNSFTTYLNPNNLFKLKINTLHSENPKKELAEKVLSPDKIKIDIKHIPTIKNYNILWYCSYLLIEKAKDKYENITKKQYKDDHVFLSSYKEQYLQTDMKDQELIPYETKTAIELLKKIKDTLKVLNRKFITACKKYYEYFLHSLSTESDYDRNINNIYPQITKDMLDELILYKLINKVDKKQLFEDPAFKFLLNKVYTDICKIMNLYNVVYSKTKEKEDTQKAFIGNRHIIPN
jgi:hypothetical protein